MGWVNWGSGMVECEVAWLNWEEGWVNWEVG